MRASKEGREPGQEVFGQISADEMRNAAVELCQAGILTCTRGDPGEPGATYALAWIPLDDPDQYPSEIRDRNAANLSRLLNPDHDITK